MEAKDKRTYTDRRSGEDQRDAFNLNVYVDFGAMLKEFDGMEKRKTGERRSNPERREHWVRVSEWSSVYVGEGGGK